MKDTRNDVTDLTDPIEAAVERIWSLCIRSTVGRATGTEAIRAELLAHYERGRKAGLMEAAKIANEYGIKARPDERSIGALLAVAEIRAAAERKP